MSTQLKALQDEAAGRHAEVLTLNERLEERVHERTLALAVANRELEYLAMHDPLTGLPKHILLQDRLLQAIRSTNRESAPFALMVIDLDGFKDVNDSLGHHAGDRLLQETAMRLLRELRQSDTAVRLGGDEFAVLLPTVATKEGAETVARKLMRALEEPVMLGDANVRVTASFGVALFPAHGDEVGDLLRRADRAMYEAKRERQGFLVFASRMEEEGDDRLRLQADLERAIGCGELVLHYQPKIDLLTGKTSRGRGAGPLEASEAWYPATRALHSLGRAYPPHRTSKPLRTAARRSPGARVGRRGAAACDRGERVRYQSR